MSEGIPIDIAVDLVRRTLKKHGSFAIGGLFTVEYVSDLRSERDALASDLSRMREALEGLVSAVSDCRVKPEDMPQEHVVEVTVRRKDLVQLNEQFDIARAALSPAEKGEA